MRSAILAQRARQAQAQAQAQAQQQAHAEAAAPGPSLSLPRWNGDISQKGWRREEANARSREETARKRARREGAAAEGGGSGDKGAAAAEEDGSRDSGDEAAAPPVLSSAKRAFLEQRQRELSQRQCGLASTDRAPSSSSSSSPLSSRAAVSAAASHAAASSGPALATPAAVPAADAGGMPPFRSKAVRGGAAAAASATALASASKKLAPLHRGSGVSPIKKPPGSGSNSAQQEEKVERYYNIGFCTRSTKKHKNYEDGVLVVRNMSSQQVSTCLVPFSTDKLEEGGSYFVATSEVLLGTPIPAEEYMSGRCFVGSTSAPTTPTAAAEARPQASLTPFARIKASNARAPNAEAAAAAVQAALADPSLLILNKSGVVDRGEKLVLVESFLSKHLREHQREGVQWMYNAVMGLTSRGYEGCILADEMGLGKTLQAISLLHSLLSFSPSKLRGGEVSKGIIVCPATLLNNWNKEFTKWLGSHRCKPVVVTASVNAAQQQSQVEDFVKGAGKDYSVLIISYELFRKHTQALSQLTSVLLICDEGHRLKSTTSNKTISALSKLKTRKRVMLTGTPVQNDLGEFFAMCDFVCPNIMGSLPTFRKTFEIPISRGRDASADVHVKALGEARAEELAKRTQGFVIRRSSELLLQYLPEKVEQVLFIPLTPMQAELYRALLRSKDVRRLLAQGSGGGAADALSLQCIGNLKKLANHPGLVYEECKKQSGADDVKSAFSIYPDNYVPVANYADVSQSSKLAVLDHLLAAIKEEGGRVVVVSNYIQTLDALQAYLQAKGYGFLRLDGTTAAADRPAIVDRFNATYKSEHFVLDEGDKQQQQVFLLSAKAGGVGLNLIGGNRLILFDPDWNPAVDLQAMSRVWRDGQSKTVFIYRFLATATIDEKIYQRQIRKNELSFSVMQKGGQHGAGAGAGGGGDGMMGGPDAGAMRNFDAKSLRDIFSYRDVTLCETQDVLRKTKKSEEEREEMDMSLGEFQTDLQAAKDPLLRTLPSHLVSAFLNRVSSVEENRRLLAQLTERKQKKMEQELAAESNKGAKKGKGARGNEQEEEEIDMLDEDEEGASITDENTLAAAASASSSSASNRRAHHRDSSDDDEGEHEYGQSMSAKAAPASAPVAPRTLRPSLHGGRAPPKPASPARASLPATPTTSWPSHEEWQLAAEMLEDDGDLELELDPPAPPTPSHAPPVPPAASAAAAFTSAEEGDEEDDAPVQRRSGGRKRNSRALFDEDEEDGEGEEEEEHAAEEQQQASEETDDAAGLAAAAPAPLVPHPALDAAATSIVPPPSPEFLTFDSISGAPVQVPSSTASRSKRGRQ